MYPVGRQDSLCARQGTGVHHFDASVLSSRTVASPECEFRCLSVQRSYAGRSSDSHSSCHGCLATGKLTAGCGCPAKTGRQKLRGHTSCTNWYSACSFPRPASAGRALRARPAGEPPHLGTPKRRVASGSWQARPARWTPAQPARRWQHGRIAVDDHSWLAHA